MVSRARGDIQHLLLVAVVTLCAPAPAALAQAPPKVTSTETPGRQEAPPETPEALRTKLGKARALWDRGQLERAQGLYDALIKAHPDLAWLRLEYGQALNSQGLFSQARPHLERAAQLDPLNLEARLGAALCMDLLGDTREAARMYGRVLMLDPAHEKARFRLGRLQYEQRDLNAAESTYRELVARNPRHWKALNNLGMVLLERQEPTASLGPLLEAHKLQPRDPGILHNLGRAYMGRQEYQKALGYFDRALVRWGANDIAAVRLHFDRGNALYHLDRLPEAAQAYRRALKLDPDYSPAHMNLGSVLASQGRNQEALKHLERAADYDSERANLYNEIALRYLESEDLEEAMKSLQRSRALDGQNPRTFFLLSRLYKARGELSQAREAQAQACTLGYQDACQQP